MTSTTLPFFNIGMTFAVLNASKYTPLAIVKLKICAGAMSMLGGSLWSRKVEISSRPLLFCGFISEMILLIS